MAMMQTTLHRTSDDALLAVNNLMHPLIGEPKLPCQRRLRDVRSVPGADEGVVFASSERRARQYGSFAMGHKGRAVTL